MGEDELLLAADGEPLCVTDGVADGEKVETGEEDADEEGEEVNDGATHAETGYIFTRAPASTSSQSPRTLGRTPPDIIVEGTMLVTVERSMQGVELPMGSVKFE